MPGLQVCRFHGGATRAARAAAARHVALAKVGTMLGIPRDVDPATALIETVQLAAGDLEYLAYEVRQLEGGLVKPTPLGAGVDVRVQLYHAAQERLAKVSKLALEAGIAERQVRIAERMGVVLASVVAALLSDPGLALSPSQQAVGRQVAADLMRRLPAAAMEGRS